MTSAYNSHPRVAVRCFFLQGCSPLDACIFFVLPVFNFVWIFWSLVFHFFLGFFGPEHFFSAFAEFANVLAAQRALPPQQAVEWGVAVLWQHPKLRFRRCFFAIFLPLFMVYLTFTALQFCFHLTIPPVVPHFFWPKNTGGGPIREGLHFVFVSILSCSHPTKHKYFNDASFPLTRYNVWWNSKLSLWWSLVINIATDRFPLF